MWQSIVKLLTEVVGGVRDFFDPAKRRLRMLDNLKAELKSQREMRDNLYAKISKTLPGKTRDSLNNELGNIRDNIIRLRHEIEGL